jgi:hypothetical protein
MREVTRTEEGWLGFQKWGPASAVVGVIGVVLCIVLMFVPGYGSLMMGSYLYGFMFWVSVALGMLALTLLHHTVRGSWALPLLRMWEAGGGPVALLVMAVLFLPIMLNMGGLYEWAHPEMVAHDPVLQHKAPYLNPIFVFIRYVLFFAIWIFVAAVLRKSTVRQDASRDFNETRFRMNLSAPMMVLFVLTATFVMTDWVMSLQPHWSSTIYTLWWIVGQSLAALALSAVVFGITAHRMPFRDVATSNVTRDIGNMLFVLTMLWGYVSISQYIIIWSGNIPEFTQFYSVREGLGWPAIGMALIFGQFLVPFMMLLSPRVKRTPMRLAKIAGWIFVMRLVDVYYIVIPALTVPHGDTPPLRPPGAMPHFTDALAIVAIGAVWLAVFSLMSRKALPMQTYDNRLQEDLAHAH